MLFIIKCIVRELIMYNSVHLLEQNHSFRTLGVFIKMVCLKNLDINDNGFSELFIVSTND